MQALKPATKPSKQRKRLYQAPDHIRYKLMAAPLSPELKASHGVRSLPVRSGDTVRVMRGDHKGFEGKITRVDRKNYRIYVEGLTREKVDGTTIFASIHPSKVMITKLNLDDKWRKKVLERKKSERLKREKIVEKTPKKVLEVKEEVAEEKLVKEKPKKRKKAPVKKPRAKKAKKETKKEKEKKPKKRKRTTKKRTTRKTKSKGGT